MQGQEVPRLGDRRRRLDAALIRAEKLWRTVQGMLRITVGRSVKDELPAAAAAVKLPASTTATTGKSTFGNCSMGSPEQ